ncbi:MAG: biotin transporter BioY [Dehalococcoidia bacterium]
MNLYYSRSRKINKNSNANSKSIFIPTDRSILIKLSISILLILLTSIFAQFRFFIPGNPVPITFQTMGILLMGGVLGPKWGLSASTGYILLGLAGIPVFQGGNGGWDYSLGVTGGYLIGFLLSSFVVGILVNKGLNGSKSIWAYIIGTLTVYIPALIWLSVFDFSWPGEGMLLSQGVYPFLIGDMIKAIIASLFTVGLTYSSLKNYLYKK